MHLGSLLSGMWRNGVMRIGRWSEEISCVALPEERRGRSEVANDMSGDVWLVLVLNGFRVGESVLSRMFWR